MPDPKPGSFSAFLEYSQRKTDSSRAPVPGPTALLTIIQQREDKSISIGELADRSDMSGPDFQNALKTLSDSGFVELSGSPLPLTVKLTSKGQDVAKLFS